MVVVLILRFLARLWICTSTNNFDPSITMIFKGMEYPKKFYLENYGI